MHRIALSVLLVVAAAGAQDPPRASCRKIAVLHFNGDAPDPSGAAVLQSIEQVRDWGADCVVLDVGSGAGMVLLLLDAADEVFLLGRSVRTVAWVERRAIRGAALLALSCREIVMGEGAVVGDCQVLEYAEDGNLQEASEEIHRVVAETLREYAAGNGHPVALAEAMVRPGEPVSFTASEAIRYGLCSRTAPDLETLLASLAPTDAEARPAEIRPFIVSSAAASTLQVYTTPGPGWRPLLAVEVAVLVGVVSWLAIRRVRRRAAR